MKHLMLAAGLAALATVSASAAKTSYTYDARGRLTSVCDATNNVGNLATYRHDAADNRQQQISKSTTHSLFAAEGIYSADGRFWLTMQTDSNFVLYGNFGAGWTPLWATATNATGAHHAEFQWDGNLVVYNSSAAVWASGTYYPCATLTVQNDGNVVITNVDGVVVWHTATGGH
jgi:YD repeat-containing protein